MAPAKKSTANKKSAPSSFELAAVEAFPFLVDALGIAALGLLVPTSLSLPWRFGAQLGLLSVLAVVLAYRLLPRADTTWFQGSSLSYRQRVFGTGLALIIMVTGTVGLVTLASSAALRFQPSTQMFQLLSALDIAWASATVMLAAYWLWNRRAALYAGAAVVAVCIWAVWRYIDNTGFGPKEGWRLRGDALWEYVVPYDMAVAAIAIGMFWVAIRRRAAAV